MSLRILADANMPGLEMFEALGRVETRPGRSMTRADLARADVLLVRSVTRVDRELLRDTPVRFVGSATIGHDHVDRTWLAEQGIAFAHAPGCNARAVAEYDLQVVFDWLVDTGRPPEAVRVGVVGCGHTGGLAGDWFRAAGMTVLACDPPRERAGEPLPGTPVTLDQALEADIVSLHVPLIDTGPEPTRHLLDAPRLARMDRGQLLINTCRGAVVDNAALRQSIRGDGPEAVLDVWEGEPGIDAALFHSCRFGTPHIAGYSREGKLRGTAALYVQLNEWLGRSDPYGPVEPPREQLARSVASVEDVLALLRERYDLRRDHRMLARALESSDPASAFDALRRDYPLRHECAGLAVTQVAPPWRALMDRLGVGEHATGSSATC